ncbi:MAG: hypothetical protein ABI779_00815 [Acidobacteriota bacterium]
MSASLSTLKLPATPPHVAGARTSVAALLLADGAAARRDSTGARPSPRRGRDAVLSFDFHLARKETNAIVTAASRDFLIPAPMRTTTRVDILVPLADNDGRPFLATTFHTFENYLATLCGGFTRRGNVEGVWRSPETGTIMRDRSRSYVVTLAAEAAEEQIAQIESFICRYFRQEAAFLELTQTRATVF